LPEFLEQLLLLDETSLVLPPAPEVFAMTLLERREELPTVFLRFVVEWVLLDFLDVGDSLTETPPRK